MIDPELFLYNPALLPREVLKRLFLVRRMELEEMLHTLRSSGQQHLLVIGERGMGKTTLLVRLAHAVEEDEVLNRIWLPVRFDEEQYNVGELADFWLNCLDKIGEVTGDPEPHRIIDELLNNDQRKELGETALEEAAFLRLRQYSIQRNRRLLLLVDNLDLVLARIDPELEARRLREALVGERWLSLVGAATDPIPATYEYGSPFYELFKIVTLDALTREESWVLLEGLGAQFDCAAQIAVLLEERRELLEVLYLFMRGNLRTTTILFSLLRDRPEAELELLIDLLLDHYTPLYKDRIESLPPQGQRVFDALARVWNPATAEQVASDLRIDRGVASGQLHRLADRRLVSKKKLPQRSMGFEVRDRLFNLWYLMRGGRRQRKLLEELIEFVVRFYRRSRVVSSFECLLHKLHQLSLVEETIVTEAREQALRWARADTEENPSLFPVPATVSASVGLLALCYNQQFEKAEAWARRVLETGINTALTRVVLAYLLEEKQEFQEALSLLEAEIEANPRPLLQLERARLQIRVGKTSAITEALNPASQFEEVPPFQLAASLVALARQGGEDAAMLLNAALESVRRRAPEHPEVLLAISEIERIRGRSAQATETFQKAVAVTERSRVEFDTQDLLLEQALRLAAAGFCREVLKALQETGWAEVWLPLAHALAVKAGAKDTLVGLAPEMADLTRFVLERIDEPSADRAAPPPSSAAAG
jgi:tetratricopeptide (TPR) repeat protein